MFVLIDTTDLARVRELLATTPKEAEWEAFALLDPDERRGCEKLEDYQDGLGPSQWYHVVEIEPAKTKAA